MPESNHPEPSWHGANPDAPDFRETLHERYREIRKTHPVHLTPRGTWRLTLHADCERLLRGVKSGVRTTDGRMPLADEEKLPRLFMLDQDPPNHKRLRRLVAGYFTPKAMEALEERTQEICDELVAAMKPGEIDIVSALALPLPTAVICEMVGVPTEDRHTFGRWTSDLTYVLLGKLASPEQQKRAGQALANMTGYIGARVAERRKNLGDDLLSVLISAEEEGDRLSEPELMWQSVGLILAGFETTTGLIGAGLRRLLLEPEQLARLRAAPELLPRAVEECLRFDPPVVGVRRYLHEEATFGGYSLPPNTSVIAVIASANRDPAVFDDPDRFDVGRDPNPHLSFSTGMHVCLGNHLARMEGRIALGTLLRRFTSLELLDQRQHWSGSLLHVLGELRVSAR